MKEIGDYSMINKYQNSLCWLVKKVLVSCFWCVLLLFLFVFFEGGGEVVKRKVY